MDDGLLIQIALFAVLFAWFCLPGYWLARALRRDGGRCVAAAEGFVYSLAAFAVIAWPCLWHRIRAEVCWSIVAAVWPVLSIAAVVLKRRMSQTPVGVTPLDDPRTDASPGGLAGVVSRAESRVERWLALAVLADYLVLSGGLAASLAGKLSPLQPLAATELACLGGWLLVGTLLFPLFRISVQPRLHDVGAPAPKVWTAAAILTVTSLAVGTAFAARPDWDDTWYLSAVQRYSEGGELNREGFSLPREGFVPPHMRLLAWELFGATLCRFSGLHAMISHHTLLPPILLRLSRRRIGACLPRAFCRPGWRLWR